MDLLSRYETFLFDMGNTLLDFHQGLTDAEKDTIGLNRLKVFLRECGCFVTTEYLQTAFFQLWTEDFYKRSRDGIELDVERYLNKCLSVCDFELLAEDCVKAMKLFFSEYKQQVVVAPEAHEVLGLLKQKGKDVAVVSNCTLYADIFIDVFEYVGLDKYIDAYAFSYAYGVRKPNRILFQGALDQLDGNPSKSIMIGDSIEADLIGAHKLGIETVWYNKKGKENVTGFVPDYVIQSFPHLLQILTQRNSE